MSGFQPFVGSVDKLTAVRIAGVLQRAGVRIEERVHVQTGRIEYVAYVHPDDWELAKEAYMKNSGPNGPLPTHPDQS